MRKSLYNPSTYQESIKRIQNITDKTTPIWGKMNAAQMMAHCAEVMDVYNGDKPFGKVSWIARIFKKMVYQVVAGDKPYGKGGPTLPQFKITLEKDFENERARLLKALDKFYKNDEEVVSQLRHPLFGTLSRDERGWAMFKHLDHHLRQFGA